MRSIRKCKNIYEFNDHAKNIKPIADLVRKTWNVEGLAPKGHAEYDLQAEQERFQELSSDDLPLNTDYKGWVNDNFLGWMIHQALSNYGVASLERSVADDPLEVLIDACVAYGACMERRRQELQFKEDAERHNKFVEKMVKICNRTGEKLGEDDLKVTTSFSKLANVLFED